MAGPNMRLSIYQNIIADLLIIRVLLYLPLLDKLIITPLSLLCTLGGDIHLVLLLTKQHEEEKKTRYVVFNVHLFKSFLGNFGKYTFICLKNRHFWSIGLFSMWPNIRWV